MVVDLAIGQAFLLIVTGPKESLLTLGTHKMLKRTQCTVVRPQEIPSGSGDKNLSKNREETVACLWTFLVV